MRQKDPGCNLTTKKLTFSLTLTTIIILKNVGGHSKIVETRNKTETHIQKLLLVSNLVCKVAAVL